MSADCDLLIIGAGPAGLAAAVEARRHDLRVVLVDEQPAPGGQIWRGLERRAEAGRPLFGAEPALDLIRSFRASGTLYRPQSQVWRIDPGFDVYITQDDAAAQIGATAVLLATGAQERPTPFPGWTLPGVMTVGAAQILLKTADQVPQEPVWIAGTGPLLLLYANQLQQVGASIAGILDTAPTENRRGAFGRLFGALASAPELMNGLRWIRELRRAGVPIIKGARELAAHGDRALETFSWSMPSGERKQQEAGLLLVHEGIVPSIHTTLALGCEHDWSSDQLCFLPRLDPWGQTTLPSLYVAGDGAAIGGSEAARLRGEITAIGIAARLGHLAGDPEAAAAPARARLTRALAVRPLLDVLYRPRAELFQPSDATLVCRCEEVSAKHIREAAAVGIVGPNQIKSFTRCGMGPCQGRECGYTVSAMLAEITSKTMDEIGFYRIRPPLKPITIGQLAALVSDDVPMV